MCPISPGGFSSPVSSSTTETERQVELAEEAFEALGTEPTQRDSRVTRALLEDKEQFDASVTDDELRNFRYLALGLGTERVERTTCEGLLMTAEDAGLRDGVTGPLGGILKQEEKTPRKLQGLREDQTLRRSGTS